MTVLFRPDTVQPNDPAGFGAWRIGHYLDHRQLIEKARALTNPVQVPDYDLGYWNDEQRVVTSWLNRHYEVHLALRQPIGIGGIDLSAVDLSKTEEWFIWMEDHAQDHRVFNVFYGL